ncbi:5-carboxymethyl-2-hydroxymuconate isomerase [Paenibacillus sp. FSL A5-0031]|uniref:fumarylacetoacetate hydrolase family protein n=1 Tax=Paenibacillus sp. FSL A5-0031 TaxID=1920420 RepID=UPI00096D1B3E|nr:fumarylacetoacetate hydrolase family protein [Paenibacillus sp. FSL A5-0031]OME86030.1 5-carboxymethyl-2-hydroxymuconate isomerase [Paenibacillus sp. FSL A5-0031]
MKLLVIQKENGSHLGVKLASGVLDIVEALKINNKPNVPTAVMEVIEGGSDTLGALSQFVEEVSAALEQYSAALYREEDITFGPCVTEPGKIICIGLNYRKHAHETNAPIPAYPILFNKFDNTVAAHGEDIPLPTKVTSQVDYEAELVIVIGKKTKYVEKGQALEHVFGYCCVNDLSARDLQMRTQQWLLGKSLDKFSPLGPYLVTADEIADPNNLSIGCTVNGEVRQQSNTSDMVFSCDEIVSYVSQHMTLSPGDIILTGTPEGVVLGYPEEKRVWLKAGDTVTIEIEKLGSLTNRFVEEVQ